MNGLLFCEIIFSGLILLFSMTLFLGKKKKGVVKFFRRSLMLISGLSALIIVLGGTYLYKEIKTTDNVTVEILNQNEVEELVESKQISYFDYKNYRNGNCDVVKKCNNEFCWFTTVISYEVVYNR